MKSTQRRKGAKAQTLLQEEIDKTIEAIIAAKRSSAELGVLSDGIRKCLDSIDAALWQISSFGDMGNQTQPLADRIRRQRELLNTAELGSFQIQVNRAMEVLWERLPR